MEQNGDNEDASKVRVSFSKDQGGTWSKPVSPHHDGTQTEHGFASLFQAPGAGLGLVWIDGRATNPEKGTGDMSLRASIYDRSGKQLREMVVTPRVCECCSAAAAETPEGVIVAFRNRRANEIRKIRRHAICRRPLERADYRARGRMANRSVSHQWPGNQRATPGCCGSVVYCQ